MGVLFDYFSAATDEEAAEVTEWVGGPTCPPLGTVPKDSVDLKGIDPYVMMGSLEALLTGQPYDVITGRPRHGAGLGPDEDLEWRVCTITDEFAAALSSASDERISSLAEPWSQTDEFWGRADPSELREQLIELRDLAVRTTQRGHRLYCWWSP